LRISYGDDISGNLIHNLRHNDSEIKSADGAIEDCVQKIDVEFVLATPYFEISAVVISILKEMFICTSLAFEGVEIMATSGLFMTCFSEGFAHVFVLY
jgi:hypothetical protein